MTILKQYMKKHQGNFNKEALSYYSAIDSIYEADPIIAKSIVQELYDQNQNIKLIASENFSSLKVQLAHGNLLNDKYSEGYPKHRFYAGCDNVDVIESRARDLACELFEADHAYVQPHSGADANLVAYLSILYYKIQTPLICELGGKKPTDLSEEHWMKVREKTLSQKLLAMDLNSGGHLTHGYRFNISALLFDVHTYGVSKETHQIDYDEIYKKIKDVKPFILLAGYSAYSRKINFAKLKQMADEVGAVFMVDMAHFAGLVAGKVFTGDFDPVKHADVVTTTTHKTLRGPRGGMILCKKEFKDAVNKGCPLALGGPLPQVMAAKALAFKEALTDDFKAYAKRIVENSNALSEAFIKNGIEVSSGGTDNHIVRIDVWKRFGLTGMQAENALREANLTMNRNTLPFDKNGAWFTSGLRLGTPAVTTLGMGKSEMEEISDIINHVLSNTKAKEGKKSKYTVDKTVIETAKKRSLDLLHKYPLYPELDHDIIFSIL
jgi:glycine hydroxymethyltransferase